MNKAEKLAHAIKLLGLADKLLQEVLTTGSESFAFHCEIEEMISSIEHIAKEQGYVHYN